MLLRWNMLFFDFCVRYLRLFDYFSAGKLALPKNAKLGRHNGAAKMRQVGNARTALPNLQQVWFKYAKLTVSMAVQAILGAFPAAPGSMIMLVGLLAYFVVTLLWLLKLRINAVCKSAGSCSASRL